jgi:hypothetical protein
MSEIAERLSRRVAEQALAAGVTYDEARRLLDRGEPLPVPADSHSAFRAQRPRLPDLATRLRYLRGQKAEGLARYGKRWAGPQALTGEEAQHAGRVAAALDVPVDLVLRDLMA